MGARVSHAAFFATVFVKGFDGVLETLAGFAVLFAGPLRAYDWIIWSVAPDLETNFGDHVSTAVQHGAGQLALSGTFLVFYLLAHGPVKLALAICLLRERLWAFAPGAAVLLGFALYLGWRAAERHSLWLAAFAALDAVTLALVLNEWRRLSRDATRGERTTA